MRVALVEEAARLFELCGGSAEVHRPSGADAQAGDLLLSAAGAAAGLLLAWKVAQTGMEVASGIAGETARILGLLRAAGHPQPLACTRKTPPGGRALAVRAVLAGGGVMHRLGLSESLLVLPEHRLFLSPEVLPERLAGLRAAQPEKRLVVEVGDEAEALALVAAGAEVLQLERFTPDALRRLKRALQARGCSRCWRRPAASPPPMPSPTPRPVPTSWSARRRTTRRRPTCRCASRRADGAGASTRSGRGAPPLRQSRWLRSTAGMAYSRPTSAWAFWQARRARSLIASSSTRPRASQGKLKARPAWNSDWKRSS